MTAATTTTLVIVLAETRASELTFENAKSYLIDELNADLCICIGINKDYNYENEFYKLAKYKFLYDEPDNYADAFDYAEKEILQSVDCSEIKNPRVPWREFLKLKDQFLGGIKIDPSIDHPGSAGILIFFRWFLLKNLKEFDLINKYDRFVITRSDYIYRLPHPKMEILDGQYIWIPDEEKYGGVTDRHVVLSKPFVEPYLNILNCFILRSYEYYSIMMNFQFWNLERLILFHLQLNNYSKYVKFFPYVMFSVRSINGTTRWSQGVFNTEMNCYIKYMTEYDKSNYYKNSFQQYKTKMTNFPYNVRNQEQPVIDQFYLDIIYSGKTDQDMNFYLQMVSLRPTNARMKNENDHVLKNIYALKCA